MPASRYFLFSGRFLSSAAMHSGQTWMPSLINSVLFARSLSSAGIQTGGAAVVVEEVVVDVVVGFGGSVNGTSGAGRS